MKSLRLFSLTLIVLSTSALAHAQNGCVNSPENPTALLGLVGLGGAAISTWRARRR